MSRVKRLQLVLDMVKKQEQAAAEALDQARQLKSADEQKLEELTHYYEDYESACRQPAPFIRAEDMQRQRGFLVRLSEACAQQIQVVERRCVLCDGKREEWRQIHLKRKAMQELIEQFKRDEARELSKKEEKMLDEWFNQSSHLRSRRMSSDQLTPGHQ